jgi:S-methylmethionine-dependent homocysteine/selenocysteine methylase
VLGDDLLQALRHSLSSWFVGMAPPGNPLQAVLETCGRRAVILDGGFATQLERIGKDLSQAWPGIPFSVLHEDPTHDIQS